MTELLMDLTHDEPPHDRDAHVHDEPLPDGSLCCECGSPDHCCCECPVFMVPHEQGRRMMRSPVAYEVFDGIHQEMSACVRLGCTPVDVDQQRDRSQA